jgi:hypothetical protein
LVADDGPAPSATSPFNSTSQPKASIKTSVTTGVSLPALLLDTSEADEVNVRNVVASPTVWTVWLLSWHGVVVWGCTAAAVLAVESTAPVQTPAAVAVPFAIVGSETVWQAETDG